ncbi:MAG: hypothetical protein HN561_04510, partial [Candidatus Scalindua sp.]|nr:hypothetical protein [Candidatus Scalindua sp.]
MEINRNTIIKNLVKKYPQTMAVFREYNLVVAGGVRGPNEPLAFFAKAHDVDYDEIVEKLKVAIEEGIDENAEEIELVEDKVYSKFFKTALLMALTIGVAVGAIILTYIGSKHSFHSAVHSLVQTHGHAQLFGWVGLCIIGFAYYIVPRVKNVELKYRELTTVCFYLMVTGTVLRILVQPYANKITSVLLPISGLLEFLAVAIFAFIIFSTVLASKEKREAYDKFIMAGVLWFLLCGVINLFMDG